METRPKIGEIFVAHGILSDRTVERMLLISKRSNKRFGLLLEELELVTAEELAAALASQHACRVASNFSGLSYSQDLLATIPVETAMQNYIFPLKLEGSRLALAIADPTEMRVVRNLSVEHNLSITPYVATRKEIHAAICRNYLKKEVRSYSVDTILLVESDRDLGRLFAEALGKQGYRVNRVTDGLEAYKAILTEKPKVVITDHDMPNLHDYGFFDALRTMPELSNIPVMLVASSANPDDELKAFERGFFDFLQKPVREATVITRVKRALQYGQRSNRLF